MYQIKHQNVRDLKNFDLLSEETYYNDRYNVTTYFDRQSYITHAIAIEVTGQGFLWNDRLLGSAAPLRSCFHINRTFFDYEERPASEYNVAFEKLKIFSNRPAITLSQLSEKHSGFDRLSRYHVYLNNEMVTPTSIWIASNAQAGDILYFVFFDADKHNYSLLP
jgi:aromatic ring-cleaving dioxygenase